MQQSNIDYRLCFKQIDQDKLERFLMTQKDELFLPDRAAAKKIVDMVFENGGILGGFDSANRIQAMFGFFFGDPGDGFADKDVLFIYVGAISKSFRLSRTFLKGIASILKEGTRLKIDQFRMHASIHDPYLNRLYGKFSNPLGESQNIRGYPVMVYEGSVEDLFAKIGPSLKTVARDVSY